MAYLVEVYERGKGIISCRSVLIKENAMSVFDHTCDLYRDEPNSMFDISVSLYEDGNLLKTETFEGERVLVSLTKEQFKFLRSEFYLLSVAYGVKGGYELEMNETKEKKYDELVEVFCNATH